MPIRFLTETALLGALITITGAIKLPGLLPGTEFQLSAPLAVAVCAAFGFKKYIIAGILSSAVGLLLGTQTLFNVYVAMIFRLVVGGVLACGGTSWFLVLLAGPLGSAAARLSLALFLGQAAWPLLAAALPGMAYTAIAAWPLTQLLRRVRSQCERSVRHAFQR